MKIQPPVILIVLLTAPVLAQEIYTWKDKNGVVHYGDQPADPAAVPLQQEDIPYSHTGSMPYESPSEQKARLRQEREDGRREEARRSSPAAPQLSRSKAWIDQKGRLQFSGVVRNSGKGLCDAPTIEVAIFDDNGNVDGNFETVASSSSLAHGEEARFADEYFTPVGTALSWDAPPRCGAGDSTVYGAHKRGELKISHTRTIRLKKFKTR
jgi:hypothetical protein